MPFQQNLNENLCRDNQDLNSASELQLVSPDNCLINVIFLPHSAAMFQLVNDGDKSGDIYLEHHKYQFIKPFRRHMFPSTALNCYK